MSEPRHRQLEIAFADNPEGGAGIGVSGVPEGPEHRPPTAIDKNREPSATETPAWEALLESIAAPENLEAALKRVVSNKGAPGVDGQTVEDVLRNKETLLPAISDALLAETYVPEDVRRVWIPKPGRDRRGLGIPTVVDRWVQEAVLLVLEPIFEPTFHQSSHGFRPGRGAQTAVAEASKYLTEGKRVVADIDIEKFFDRVNHQRLLDRVGQRVADPRVLRLIRLMLKAKVVLPDGVRVANEEGTPQGGPLSPLLANVVLDELDWELDRRNLRFVRYADDCQIFVASERAGHRVMESTRRFIEGRLRLKVNEAKSAVAPSSERHFLGFRLGLIPDGRVMVQLSKRSIERLYQRVKELIPRNWGKAFVGCCKRANQYLNGWMGHFLICTQEAVHTFRHVDARVRRRLRAILARQKKRPRFLLRALLARGVAPAVARGAAYCRGRWRQSNTFGMTRAYPNAWFATRVLSLETLWHARNGDEDARTLCSVILTAKSRM